MISLEYLAGFIDGEGCFNISQCRGTIFTRILIVNTNLEILTKIKDQFGGDISEMSNRKTKGWKPAFQFRISSTKAIELTKALLPFLIVKKEQAQLIIEFEKLRPGMGKKWNQEHKNYIVDKMHFLNKKGI